MSEAVETLCRALWKRDARSIARLLPRVDPDASDRWGRSLLLLAARHADAAVVAALLARGAAVEQGRTWLTPLAVAAGRGDADMLAVLRRAGARETPVSEVRLGALVALRRRFRRDPQLAAGVDEEGTPLLHHAAEALRPAVVALLLRHGAAIAAGDATGETALHRVADLRPQPGGDTAAMAATATALLAHGATVDARNRDHVTPLHQAVRARNLAVAEVLLAHGADPNARDRTHGTTPLRRAVCSTGATGTAGAGETVMAELTRLLLAHGADPRLRDRAGRGMAAPARSAAVLAVLAGRGGKRRAVRGSVARRERS